MSLAFGVGSLGYAAHAMGNWRREGDAQVRHKQAVKVAQAMDGLVLHVSSDALRDYATEYDDKLNTAEVFKKRMLLKTDPDIQALFKRWWYGIGGELNKESYLSIGLAIQKSMCEDLHQGEAPSGRHTTLYVWQMGDAAERVSALRY